MDADRKRQEEDLKTKALVEAIILEHPEYGYRRIDVELRRRGLVINPKRIRRLLNGFQLSLKRKVRKPKPNPLLEVVLLPEEKTNLVATLLKKREPEVFGVLHTDFTCLSYGEAQVWFLPILDHKPRTVVSWTLSLFPTAEAARSA